MVAITRRKEKEGYFKGDSAFNLPLHLIYLHKHGKHGENLP